MVAAIDGRQEQGAFLPPVADGDVEGANLGRRWNQAHVLAKDGVIRRIRFKRVHAAAAAGHAGADAGVPTDVGAYVQDELIFPAKPAVNLGFEGFPDAVLLQLGGDVLVAAGVDVEAEGGEAGGFYLHDLGLDGLGGQRPDEFPEPVDEQYRLHGQVTHRHPAEPTRLLQHMWAV
ncbi:MAG: hypothetical protein PW843_09440 [Azospirillaceae bacterium]|nr:hypothetical protein [Azospirillaceae bacterium]